MSERSVKSGAGSPHQKKGTPTLLCSHRITVQELSPRGREHDALLEEISRTQAKVSLECPLRKGSNVKIDCGECELRGKVSGCTPWQGIGGYMAEVTFPEGEQWEPGEFTPDRLLNPQYLRCENPGCTPECVNESCGTPEPGPTVVFGGGLPEE